MIIDTHAHINFSAFKKDADEVIRRSLDNNVWMINVGSQYTTSRRAVEIASRYEGVFAAIGMHPIHLETRLVKVKIDPEEIEFETREEEFDYEKYKRLTEQPKVVAIGEVGLDYYWRPKGTAKMAELKEKQKAALLRQLELARELNLPVIFHCRMAQEDLLELLRSQPGIKGVMHCFTGNREQAEQYMEMGFYIGLNGIIFKKAQGLPDYDELIKYIPLEKILVETDCPYLMPPLPAGALAEAGTVSGRNEPIYVKHTIHKIAEIKKITEGEVMSQTTKNAKELFGI